jgi:hypothetical protein
MTSIAHPPSSDVFKRPTYTPGDGEARCMPRPGSQDALAIPSLFANRRIYRDGRVEPVVQHLPADDTEGGEV